VDLERRKYDTAQKNTGYLQSIKVILQTMITQKPNTSDSNRSWKKVNCHVFCFDQFSHSLLLWKSTSRFHDKKTTTLDSQKTLMQI